VIREKDGFVYVVQPRCPKDNCNRLMVRDRVAGRMGAFGTDSLSFIPVATLCEMVFRCKKHGLLYRVPASELEVINQYPLDRQKLAEH
jgi:hypothetical protein